MDPRITDLLKDRFGFDRFLPGQAEVIAHLMEGRSAAAVFPTGGGKSLCYQLPALALPGLTLVVSPLIALMKDQIDALRAKGILAARLDSTLTAEAYNEAMTLVRKGELRLLYVAPERFTNEQFREAVLPVRVSLFAVDEAHCISEWGHNFRPDYLKLASFAAKCHAERLLALTATATPQVLDDICRLFRIDRGCAVRTGFYRANLEILMTPTRIEERDAALLRRMRERPRGATLVYVTLQRTAEVVAARLTEAGLPARPYHAGLEDDLRSQVQDWFMTSRDPIVVATIAFGMGIDKADIRFVYHYNLPKSLEGFSQEIGRAGRDGEPAICEMLVCPEDLIPLENFAYGDTPAPNAVRRFVENIFSKGNDFDVSIHELSTACDIRILVVRTLLTYLELDGYLEGGTPLYSQYRFAPLVPSKEILSRFEGERRDFLTRVFRQAKPARKWFHIDLDETARAVEAPRSRVVRALDYLAEQRLLEVSAAGVRYRYRVLKRPEDLHRTAETLFSRTQNREARELKRLAQVLDLAGHDGCQVSALGAHFGEPLERPCGHCSWCTRGGKPARIPGRRVREIDEQAWEAALRKVADVPEVLSDPRSLACFLCGVASPRLTRAKLTADALFGVFAGIPFQTVLERAEAGC